MARVSFRFVAHLPPHFCQRLLHGEAKYCPMNDLLQKKLLKSEKLFKCRLYDQKQETFDVLLVGIIV